MSVSVQEVCLAASSAGAPGGAGSGASRTDSGRRGKAAFAAHTARDSVSVIAAAAFPRGLK